MIHLYADGDRGDRAWTDEKNEAMYTTKQLFSFGKFSLKNTGKLVSMKIFCILRRHIMLLLLKTRFEFCHSVNIKRAQEKGGREKGIQAKKRSRLCTRARFNYKLIEYRVVFCLNGKLSLKVLCCGIVINGLLINYRYSMYHV